MAGNADFSAANNTVTLDFWADMWNKKTIGWHEVDGNKMMWQYLHKVLQEKLPAKKPQDLKVFVPLCGKAKDMYLLYQMGCTVVGVEFASQAIDEFFTENNLEHKENPTAPYKSSQDGRLIIGQGDLFSFSGDQSQPHQLPFEKFDVIWDRGSFEAINIKDRSKYAELMMSLMSDNAVYLIHTMNYDKNEYGGPPLAADTEDLRQVFGESVEVTLLDEVEDTQELWSKLGISKCFEQLNLITFMQSHELFQS